MFTKTPLRKRIGFLQRFFRPTIFPEAYFAYFHRLPDQVQVSWFRDEGMIIGKVDAGGKIFMTQGENAEDFIRMVNESIVTVFNIPEDYFDIVSKTKTYVPSPSEKKLLEDRSVMEHRFGLMKGERAFVFKPA